jgi:hypothetical protein
MNRVVGVIAGGGRQKRKFGVRWEEKESVEVREAESRKGIKRRDEELRVQGIGIELEIYGDKGVNDEKG